jgi:integrase
VDRDGGAIRLRPENSKNGRGRVVVLEGDLQALIARRWDARLIGDPANLRVVERVFHRDGEPVGDFRKAWATACESAGVPDRLFHDLRRTVVRNMIRAGVSETVAMRISGHRTRSVFDRYNVTSEDDLRTAAQRVDRYVDTLPTRKVETWTP